MSSSPEERAHLQEACRIYAQLDEWASNTALRDFTQTGVQQQELKYTRAREEEWKNDFDSAKANVHSTFVGKRYEAHEEFANRMRQKQAMDHQLEMERHIMFRDQRAEDLEDRRHFQREMEDINHTFSKALSAYNSFSPKRPSPPSSSNPSPRRSPRSNRTNNTSSPTAAPTPTAAASGWTSTSPPRPHSGRSSNRFVMSPCNDVDRLPANQYNSMVGKPLYRMRPPMADPSNVLYVQHRSGTASIHEDPQFKSVVKDTLGRPTSAGRTLRSHFNNSGSPFRATAPLSPRGSPSRTMTSTGGRRPHAHAGDEDVKIW